MNTKRNNYIDNLKAFAIILVIIGHAIQFGSGHTYLSRGLCLDNYIFKFIYSFHMPLFMMISGWLFSYSVTCHSFFHNVKSRISTLLVPILFWSLSEYVITYLALGEHKTLLQFARSAVHAILCSLWFLWAVLLCSFIVLFVNHFMHDSFIIYALLILLSFFLPNKFNSYLYAFMFPFFLAGYILSKTGIAEKFMNSGKKTLLIAAAVSGIVLFVMLSFYTRESYIYISKFNIFGDLSPFAQVMTDIYRAVIGFDGCLFIALIIKLIPIKPESFCAKASSAIGRNTLGLYIISGYMFSYLVPKTHKRSGRTDSSICSS